MKIIWTPSRILFDFPSPAQALVGSGHPLTGRRSGSTCLPNKAMNEMSSPARDSCCRQSPWIINQPVPVISTDGAISKTRRVCWWSLPDPQSGQ